MSSETGGDESLSGTSELLLLKAPDSLYGGGTESTESVALI